MLTHISIMPTVLAAPMVQVGHLTVLEQLAGEVTLALLLAEHTLAIAPAETELLQATTQAAAALAPVQMDKAPLALPLQAAQAAPEYSQL